MSQLIKQDGGMATVENLINYINNNLPRFNPSNNALLSPSGLALPVFAGAIIIAKPTVDGVSTSAAQVINTQVLSATMVGQQLLYSIVHRDDFGGMATSILTSPGEIIVPSGVRYGRFTTSLQLPAQTPTAAGIGWNRLMVGPIGSPVHKGNSGPKLAYAAVPNTMQTITGIFEVTQGEHYLTTAIQDSGGPLTLAVGAAINNWSSNWFMAEFFL